MFAGPLGHNGMWRTLPKQALRIPSYLPYLVHSIIQFSVGIALFWSRSSIKIPFRQLQGRQRNFPESAEVWFLLTQSNLHAKGTHLTVACPWLLQFAGWDLLPEKRQDPMQGGLAGTTAIGLQMEFDFNDGKLLYVQTSFSTCTQEILMQKIPSFILKINFQFNWSNPAPMAHILKTISYPLMRVNPKYSSKRQL